MARIDSDVYLTPPEVVADFLGRCPLPDGLWCEPAVGSDSIVRATNEERNLHHDRVLWTTCDVRPRPSGIPADVDFTGGGGDSCAYGWFVWGPSSSGRIHHAATPWRAPKERKRKAVAPA